MKYRVTASEISCFVDKEIEAESGEEAEKKYRKMIEGGDIYIIATEITIKTERKG